MKKIISLLVISSFFVILPLYAYSQIVTYGLYLKHDFPVPVDPENCKSMQLSKSDQEYKNQAEAYIKQGKFDLALAELKKISDPWASHWFISYFYEMNFKLNDALAEVSWLIHKNSCHELMMPLVHRKENIEDAIRSIKDWEKYHDMPQKKDTDINSKYNDTYKNVLIGR